MRAERLGKDRGALPAGSSEQRQRQEAEESLPPVRLRPHSASQAESAALSPNKGKNKQKSSAPASGLRSPAGISLHSWSQHRDTSGSCLFHFNVADILHTRLQPPWRLFLRVFNIPSGLCIIIYFALLLLLDGWPVFNLSPLQGVAWPAEHFPASRFRPWASSSA